MTQKNKLTLLPADFSFLCWTILLSSGLTKKWRFLSRSTQQFFIKSLSTSRSSKLKRLFPGSTQEFFNKMDFDSAEIEKFRKYEADYTRYLMAKYFSDKDIFGGIIFDKKVTIDGETIKSSRWPGTRSYADPLQAFQDLRGSASTSTEETLTNISNGKHTSKRSG